MHLFNRIFVLSFLFCSTILIAQTEDESWKIYDDSMLGRVDITIPEQTLHYILTHVNSDSEHVAKIRFRNKYIDETIDSIGFRLRGNTSREAEKKSFKISFNTFIKGRKFYGIEKLNLNGEHNDPSIMRSKISFDMYKKAEIAASRTCHINLYINGAFYGLYMNIEHIDEEFVKKHFDDDSGNLWKCLYPANLEYHGTNQNTYKQLNNGGTPVYELKTNEDENDFSKLVSLIVAINSNNNTSYQANLESILDVSSFLKYLSWNILLGSWDSYESLANNYYLYYNPSSKQFTFIPYDYDNTFGIDWAGNDWAAISPYSPPLVSGGPVPLLTKLMQINKYKDLYTHFLEFYKERLFKLELWDSNLESMKSMITNSALLDTFRTKDYGFTMNDFNNSYSSNYSKYHVKYGIRQFVNSRNQNLEPQLIHFSNEPMAYKIDYYPTYPTGTDSVYMVVSAYCNGGFANTKISVTDATSNINIEYPLVYSPIENTLNVDNYDRYIAVIPPLGNNKTVKVNVVLANQANQTTTYPLNGFISIKTQGATEKSVVINEFLADNANSVTDPSGEHDDFVELYNTTDQIVNLKGKFLTDNPTNLTKWMFPNTQDYFINPHDFLVVWLDEDLTQQGVHASFKLSKSGEFLGIVESDGASIMDSITFGAQSTDISFGRYADGTDNWYKMNPTPGAANLYTDVNEEIIAFNYSLDVYPNPFNPATNISFTLPEGNITVVKVFDILGREVSTLVNEYKSAGNYKMQFNANSLAAGVYLCRIESGRFVQTKKLLLIK